MKSWIRKTLLAVLGGTLLVGGLGACSGRHENRGWNASAEEQAKYRSKMVERVSSKLDLNEQQKTKLNVLADKLQEQRQAFRGKTTDPRAELQALVAGDKFDRARAQSLVNEKTTAITGKSPEVIAALGDFYDSLNPTQQAKVREYMQKRRGY